MQEIKWLDKMTKPSHAGSLFFNVLICILFFVYVYFINGTQRTHYEKDEMG